MNWLLRMRRRHFNTSAIMTGWILAQAASAHTAEPQISFFQQAGSNGITQVIWVLAPSPIYIINRLLPIHAARQGGFSVVELKYQ